MPRSKKERLPGDGRRLWGEIHIAHSFTGVGIFQTYHSMQLKYVRLLECQLHLNKAVKKSKNIRPFHVLFKNLQQLTFLVQKQILFFQYPMKCGNEFQTQSHFFIPCLLLMKRSFSVLVIILPLGRGCPSQTGLES